MCKAIIKTSPTRVCLAVVASVFTLTAAGAAQAVPINTMPGQTTCKIEEPGGVGGDYEGFLDPTTGQSEIELEGLDGVECGINDPAIDGDTPPPPPVPPTVDPFPYPGAPDIDLQGILNDGDSHNIVGDPAAPSIVPVPAAAWLFASGLLGLVGIARRKR